MKKLFFLILAISTFLGCKNPTHKIESPTEFDIQQAIETGQNKKNI